MKIIGVTGGIGAGKSYICNLFAELGGYVIDADEISRRVTRRDADAYHEIVEEFGSGILLPNGEIDRKALAKTVFSDKKRLECLNKITHKHIFAEMRRELNNIPDDSVVIMDVPLLFTSEFPFKCDRTVAVLADIETRIGRVAARDGADRESIIRRIKNQISDEEYRRAADICIDNSGGAKELERVVQKIYDSVRNEAHA